jgi:putative peptidoglycan lipid II flippase
MGSLRTRQTVASLLRMGVISLAAAILGWLVVKLTSHVLGTTVAGSLGTLLVGTVVIGAAAVGGLLLARVPELQEPLAAVRARLSRA